MFRFEPLSRTWRRWSGSAALPPGIRDKIFRDRDMPFLGVRLRDNAAKTWVFKNRMPLGLVTALKEKQARKLAVELYALSVLEHDPLAEKRDPSPPIIGSGGGTLIVTTRDYRLTVKILSRGQSDQSPPNKAKRRRRWAGCSN
jgi:hypothetical protein